MIVPESIYPRLNYYFPFQSQIMAIKSLLFHSNKQFNCPQLNTIYNSNSFFFFNSGHSALQFFLSQFKPGTRVGVQPVTCHTVFESIRNAGCEIVFVDIEENLLLSEDSICELINNIDILIVTHTFGNTFDVRKIKTLAENKIIIEDCCHALLSKYNGKLVGLEGDVAIFSHGLAKFPSVFSGGFLLVNNEKFLNQYNNLYYHIPYSSLSKSIKQIIQSVLLVVIHKPFIYSVITKKIKHRNKKNQYKFINLNIITKGYSFAKLLLNKELLKISSYLQIQKENGQKIENSLKLNSDFALIKYNSEGNYFMLPSFTENPERFISFAENKGIEIGQHFVQSRKILPEFGYKNGDCPNYEQIITKLITFPTHYKYSVEKINKINEIITQYEN